MTLSIKSIGGVGNEIPTVTNLRVTTFDVETIDIEYKVEDVELTICRHYLYLNGSKREITKSVGYESSSNIFKYQITGLKVNTTYTIQIGASDGLDEGLSQAVQQKTKNSVIYGVRVMKNNSNPATCCTYIDSAVGIIPANSRGFGGWKDKFPFNKLRIVGLKNGEVVGTVNPENKKHYLGGIRVPDDVDIMVEFPKVYWKVNTISNGYEIRISEGKFDGADCYAHKVGGVEKSHIYVGAFLGSVQGGKLRSKADTVVTNRYSLSDYRTYAHNVGSGYEQLTWFTGKMLQILYLIAFRNLDSQKAFGMGGCAADNDRNMAGTTFDKGWIYGDTSDYYQCTCLFGVEGLWDMFHCLIDGFLYNSSNHVLVNMQNRNFNNNASGYQDLGSFNLLSGHTAENFTDVLTTNELVFVPTKNGGSDTTYYCDFGIVAKNSQYCLGGGNFAFPEWSGIFAFEGDGNFEAQPSQCARLTYLG